MDENFIKTSILKIKEASKNNKLIVFIGAGISANSGIPNWGSLIEEMAHDLGYKEKNISSDLFLKIPQYYFNERGEKEYYDKLTKIFLSKKFKVNAIHKEIFKLNPTHLITTNYDTLLEEASLENGKFFHTVKQNSDLPYGNFNNMIIKMHGDFEHKNIVLKEDDYLNYSLNFSLIENYIKSLVSTNTVLFIGYSVNDPNFNLLFQWVKNVLRDHFQPAYLIESNKDYSRLEHSYYKNRGINIIYSNEIENLKSNFAFEKSNFRGNKLYDILSYFNSFDEYSSFDDLNKIYKKIEAFESLNFIMPKQIATSFNERHTAYDFYGNKNLTVFNEKSELINAFSNSKNYEDRQKELFERIINILKKANIRGISDNRDFEYIIETSDEYIEEITEKIIKSDSFTSSSEINDISSIIDIDNYDLLLKKAFNYNKNGNHYNAYKIYKSISLKSFHDKEYLVYYISEFNRKHVGNILFYTNSQLSEKIFDEISSINLDDIYYSLPFEKKESLKFLQELNNFNLFYKNQNQLTKEVNGIKQTKRSYESGGFSLNNSLEKNYTIIKNIWLFIEMNYLCIDNYSEVKNLYISFIKGILSSYSIKAPTEKNMFGIPVQKVEKLNKFDVYVMIVKLDTKELEDILKDNNIKNLKISNEAFDYLKEMISHLIKNNKKYDNLFMRQKNESQLFNTLILLSNLKLSKNLSEYFLNTLINLINREMYIDDFKYLNKFVVSLAKNNLVEEQFAIKYMNKYLESGIENIRFLSLDRSNLLINLARIHLYKNDKKIDKKVAAKYINLIKELFESKEIDNIIELFNQTIFHIIAYTNKSQKKIMIEYMQLIVNGIKMSKKSLSDSQLYFYQISVIHKFVQVDREINILLIKDTLRKIKNKNPGQKSIPDPIESNLTIITNLYRNKLLSKKIINPHKELLKGYSNYFDLYFDGNNVNVKNMDIISTLNDSEIESLFKNQNFKNNFYKFLESELFKEDQKDLLSRFYQRK